jgi:SAM-dependent methyltransferase
MTGGPELFAVEIGHDRIIAGSRLSRLTSSVAAIFLLVSSSIMSTHEKETFIQTYQWARDWSQLPWAHDEPTLFLAELCKQRGGRGRALDIGCGAGTDSVYLAEQGWEVTALDFVPKALEFTQARAEAAGVSVQAVEADITTWDVPHAYDLVLDHGLLHNMDPVRYPAYRERLIDAVAPDGDFVLLHWHPSYPGQTNGEVGPTRRSRDDIKAFFAPEFQERFFAQECPQWSAAVWRRLTTGSVATRRTGSLPSWSSRSGRRCSATATTSSRERSRPLRITCWPDWSDPAASASVTASRPTRMRPASWLTGPRARVETL